MEHLGKLLTKLSIYDTLIISKEMKKSLINASLEPERCLSQLVTNVPKEEEICTIKETTSVTLTNDDLLLNTVTHNWPLYISNTLGDIALVNIMSLASLVLLKFSISHLTPNTMMLKGFN